MWNLLQLFVVPIVTSVIGDLVTWVIKKRINKKDE